MELFKDETNARWTVLVLNILCLVQLFYALQL